MILPRLALVAGLTFAALARSAETRPAEPPPNFIIILADDLGYGDLGSYGSTTIATPHLDRMAREGIRLTDAYAASPYCSPSRAALLTGRLPARCGVPYVLFPVERHGLPEVEITLAELLRERGYATACIGKWHLGWAQPFRPHRHGFEVFFGTPYPNNFAEWPVGAPYNPMVGFEPFPLLEGDRVIEAPVDQAYLTRRTTERAVAFIRSNRDRPFFLYVPHTMPHIPQYASPEFTGKSKGGLYGDTVQELDWSTGVILDTLRELQLDRRTLVIFTSDNGAVVRTAAQETAEKAKQQPGVINRRNGGSNGVLRRGKGTTFEGGVRVPFIAWWPGRIAPQEPNGSVVTQLDLFPTCAKLAGAALPVDRVIDGQDLTRFLTEKARLPSRPTFQYFGYQLQAVRDGNWKLLVKVDTWPTPRPYSAWWEDNAPLFETQHRLQREAELYDLATDPGEKNNVASQHSSVVARLTQLATEFDVSLQRDRRPFQFAPGPNPPKPGTIRTSEMDLSAYRKM